MMSDYLSELLSLSLSIFSDFIDPQKRIFLGYWLSAFIIAYGYCLFKHQTLKTNLINKKIWWSDSAKADYKLFVINKLLMPLLAKGLFSQAVITYFIYQSIHGYFGLKPAAITELAHWSDASVALLFTFVLFLLGDFSRFLVHWLMHKLPMLWVFHQVHHSARVLTPMTVLRTHPVEGLLFSVRSILVHSICIASFFYLFGDRIELTTVFGASVFVFVFNILGANLRHSHVPLSYWSWLENLLVSPVMHQIHHSDDVRHFDKNMGAVLSIWDRLFGCHVRSNALDDHSLNFGLSKTLKENEHTLKTLYFTPFKMLFVMATKPLLKKKKVRT
jgi:sterol desaturase/sphingolipid hydroxylase (fatty acid hydroxylase superfamily)